MNIEELKKLIEEYHKETDNLIDKETFRMVMEDFIEFLERKE